ncbi:hypothetical protein [Achromobacter animicus]|uniref:hypothetical protein n=1 Tax=Achromobacter animicus TaxID=1389935 RepID=UPI0028AC4D42|nr:hypothetical protein [Achromobacter animicus]
MIFTGENEIDLSSPELVAFAQSAGPGATFQGPLPEVTGYRRSMANPKNLGPVPNPSNTRPIVAWTVIQTWRLFELGERGHMQPLSDFPIDAIGYREVSIEPLFHLLLQDGLDQAAESKIEAAFSSYKYPGSGDLDAFIRAALANDPSLDALMFGVGQSFVYTMVGNIQSSCTERQCPELARIHASPTWSSERYRCVLLNETPLPTHRPPTPDRNIVEDGDPETVAEDAARRELGKGGCESNEVDVYVSQIARADLLPESRLVWILERIRIGCAVVEIRYPRIEFRNIEAIATMHITVPRIFDMYAAGIRSCGRKASTAAIVQLILFANLPVAAITFKALFWACITLIHDDIIKCLDVGITVTTRAKNEWK